MKIAYLILTHAHPQQLGRLVARLATPEAHFYIHVDANTADDTFRAMQSAAPQARWAERQTCRWGGFSLVAATLKLMAMATEEGCDWLILLSGQDYPIKSPQHIVTTLMQTTFAAHLDLQADFDVGYRWQAWHFEKFNGTFIGKLLQKIQRQSQHLGLARTVPAPLQQIQAGSQWWMMSATTARTLLDFLAQHPQIIRFFEKTLVPDEMFFQTLLCHLLPAKKIGPSLRQIEWEAGSWSPKSFTTDDATRLLATPALFARKFAPDGAASAAIDSLIAP